MTTKGIRATAILPQCLPFGILLLLKRRCYQNSLFDPREQETMRYLHTMLRVRNLDAAMKFYQDALGLKEVRRIDNDKAKFTLVFLCAAEDEALLKNTPQHARRAAGRAHL